MKIIFFNFGDNQPFTLCFWAKGGDGNGGYATATPFVLSKGANFLFRNERAYRDWETTTYIVTGKQLLIS